MVSVIVECRARVWAVFGWTPLRARFVMKVCRREWKSATRPAPSVYSRPAASRSALNISAGRMCRGRLKAFAAGSFLARKARSTSAVSGRRGSTSLRRRFEHAASTVTVGGVASRAKEARVRDRSSDARSPVSTASR
ncbi:MAG: hypothetical protein MUC63_04880 [Planctomycetes bacterium]|nr:hypothetical protein [Planctomycetota bacterium]